MAEFFGMPDLDVPANDVINIGTCGALVHRSLALDANTFLDQVLVGTPVVSAIPADSIILSNVCDGGDIVFAVENNGNSTEVLRLTENDLTLNPGPLGSFNVTLTETDADALTFNDGTTDFYNIDTRIGTAGDIRVHTFDATNPTIVAGAGTLFNLMTLNPYTLTYTGTTNVQSLLTTGLRISTTTVTNTSAHDVELSTAVEITAPSEGGSTVLVDTSAIRIRNAGGSPTNQIGLALEALSSGGTDYAIVVGLPTSGTTWNTDSDQNIIAVAVTGIPIMSWDESEDAFSFSHKVLIPSTPLQVGLAGTATGTMTWAGTTSGVVTMTVVDAAGTWTLTLPTGVGAAGQVLTDAAGDGITSWTTIAGGDVNDDVLRTFGTDGDGVIVLNSAGLAADAELSNVIVGTSDHQGTAANSLIVSNITNDGDILMLANDGGNSLEFLLVNADVAFLHLGFGMINTNIYASGDITVASSAGSFNVTLQDDDADSLTFANSASNYYNIDTRNTGATTVVHLFDTEDFTVASASGAVPNLMTLNAYTLTYTGTTTVQSLLVTGLKIQTTTITDASALTVNLATGIEVSAPTEAGSVTLVDTSAIRIPNTGGTPTNQIGLAVNQLSSGATADYAIVVGLPSSGTTWNTDSDVNIVAVAVTGIPVLSWDESEDAFSFSTGIRTANVGTVSGDLTLNPAASLNVTLTDDDADAFDLANSAISYYLISTINTVAGTIAHTFDTEDATFAAAAGDIYTLATFPAYTLTYTGSTQVTSLIPTIIFGATTITDASALTVDKATTVQIAAPIEAGSVTLGNASAIRILNTTGTPTTQVGILIETLIAGATNNYMLSLGTTDVDHSLLHVGVTGDPLLLWDESQDQFSINKGLDVTAGSITFDEVDDGNSGTADTIDWGTGNKHKSTLTGNVTYTFTDPAGPCSLILRVVQDAGGGNTATWPASVEWPGGTAPIISTGANAVDVISFYFDGTTFHGNFSQNFS